MRIPYSSPDSVKVMQEWGQIVFFCEPETGIDI